MADQLMAFTGIEAPFLTVIEYPALTEVTAFTQPTDNTYACAFSVGGAFLAVIQSGAGEDRLRIYNTDSWEQEEVNGAFTGNTNFFQNDLLHAVSPEAFYAEVDGDGRFIVTRDSDGIWQVEPAPGSVDFTVYPYESGGSRKALLVERSTVASSTYEALEYDVETATATVIALPSRSGDDAWYAASMSPDGTLCALMRRVGASGSYQWDTLVLDPADWSLLASDNGWITESGSGATSIDVIPQITPDNAHIILVYDDGTSGSVRLYDYPGMSATSPGDLSGVVAPNNLSRQGHEVAPGSAYAVIHAVNSADRGLGTYTVPGLLRESPFPFELSGENIAPFAVGNDSAHIVVGAHDEGLVKVYDASLALVASFTGTPRADRAKATSGELTYTPPATEPPSEFWTGLVGARELRRA